MELIKSFSVKNDLECQMDFPMTPKTFRIQILGKIVHVPIQNQDVNKKLLNLYAMKSRP